MRLMKKALIALAGLVAALAIASFLTTRTFHAELTIPAPPDRIWAVLTDTGSYKDWNSVFVAVEGTYAVGQTNANSIRFPDGSTVYLDAKVEVLNVDREIRQTGGIPGILTFDHQWLLEPVDGGTKVTQHEINRGLYLWFWDSDWVEPAYQSTLEALKAHVLLPAE